jgi:large subunit ribosomal protein L21
MFAVVSSGGKQYRVEAGSTVVIDRLEAEPGASVTLDQVLLISDGDSLTVGQPTVAGAVVRGTVLAQGRGPKIIIFKFKQKAKYRRRTGHRQYLTSVRIDAIEPAGSAAAEKPKRARRAKAVVEEA